MCKQNSTIFGCITLQKPYCLFLMFKIIAILANTAAVIMMTPSRVVKTAEMAMMMESVSSAETVEKG